MILSASRRTDIPAFYSEWIANRLETGFLYVRNPFNTKQISKINLSPELIECIVFWTKNPKNIIQHLPLIDTLGHKYYFQFTITSYDTSIEQYVPKKESIINTFRELSDKIGSEKIIWRYDPILLTDKYNIEYHIKWFDYLAKNLNEYTSKCIISFVDMYKKCIKNLKDLNINEVRREEKKILSKALYEIATSYNIQLESCAEELELAENGIAHAKCIDDKLISRIINKDIIVTKDKTQRSECGCVSSIDIGAYNTCKHGCKYCYANFNQKTVEKNWASRDKQSPLITGQLSGDEKITIRKITPLTFKQKSLFYA